MRTVLMLMLSAVAAFAQEQPPEPEAKDPRITDGGRERAFWPPDRPFDHLHMRLALTIPDMLKPELSAVETLRITPIGTARRELRLNAKNPKISSIMMIAGGSRSACDFKAERPDVFITLPRDVRVGETVELEIVYTLDFSGDKGEGLTWSKGRESAKSQTRQFPQIHSQGQADENSRWFVCHDFPNERLSTELIVDIEDGYEVLSNGSLVSKKSKDGRTTWHWLQQQAHPNYLVTLVIGKFAVLDVGGAGTAKPNLWMPVYVDKGREENAKKLFARTADMVLFFEKAFDEPYPWDKYAQACVRDFVAGGMENTSATSLYDAVVADPEGDQDDLIAHELAHQWFGDLVTCEAWEHLWLNEGWASFSEALWRQELARQQGRDSDRAYQRAILSSVRAQRGRNRASFPKTIAMVSNRYEDPDKLFSRTDDVYSKGAIVLHMLRQRLGEATMLKGTAAYLDSHKHAGVVETDDFRRALEEAGGESLERFFDQWVMRPGMATLDVNLDFEEASNKLTVAIEQKQTIDYLNPAYAFELPVRIRFEDGSIEWRRIAMDTRQTTAVFELKAKPTQVTVDPEITVLARTNVVKPLAMWIEDLERGPTVYAQLMAAEAIAQSNDAHASEILAVAAKRFSDLPELRGYVMVSNTQRFKREFAARAIDVMQSAMKFVDGGAQ
jgi:aminopeptidase N